MKSLAIALSLALAAFAQAQTAPKPASHAAPTTSAATKKPAAPAAASTYKLPPDEKRVPTIPKTAFSLRYQDIKLGTGPEGEAGKLWHVKYKGWRASDGVVFDAWDKHSQPVMGKDGKPETGPDGKPKMSDPEPMVFSQGVGRMIPGFDYGLTGMKIGGKRRLFIPWQMAYGNRAMPDRGADHPGIPAKSDLIFDVELVQITDMPQQPQHPMGTPPNGRPGAGSPGTPGAPAAPGSPSTPSTPPAAGSPAAPGSTATPPPAAAPATPPAASTPPAPTTPKP